MEKDLSDKFLELIEGAHRANIILLSSDFPNIRPEEIKRVYDSERAEFAEATVSEHIPLFVERRTRNILRTLPGNNPPRSSGYTEPNKSYK